MLAYARGYDLSGSFTHIVPRLLSSASFKASMRVYFTLLHARYSSIVGFFSLS